MSDANTQKTVSRELQNRFSLFCARAASTIEKIPFLQEQTLALKNFEKSARTPFNVAVFGRMKTGKSSLINALIGENLAITDTTEATATINVISYSVNQCRDFTVHWKDKPPETYPLEKLKEWTGKTDAVIEKSERTSFIQLYSSQKFLKFCEVTDTPGTDSTVSEHEKITQNFLAATDKQGRKADAIIYVFEPVARESDLDDLDKFQENNCIPNSSPYNSVAVMHKWDHLFWENGGDINDIKQKAQKIYSAMGSLIADVIPVSAPLAMASVKAPDCFFSDIQILCKEYSWKDLEHALKRDRIWENVKMKEICQAYPLPRATIQIIVREVFNNREKDIEIIRKRLRELSGIDRLTEFLDHNFFKRKELIKQKQKYVEIVQIKKKVYQLIEDKLSNLDPDIKFWDSLYKMDIADSKLVVWLSKKREKARNERNDLSQKLEALDKEFLNSPIPQLIQDDKTLNWCKEKAPEKIFTPEQIDQIQGFFNHLAGDSSSMGKIFDSLEELLKKVTAVCYNDPRKEVRDNASHIKDRLSEFLNSKSWEK